MSTAEIGWLRRLLRVTSSSSSFISGNLAHTHNTHQKLKTHNAHKNTRKHRKHIKHTKNAKKKKKKNIYIKIKNKTQIKER